MTTLVTITDAPYNAVGDGTTDNSTAFALFNTNMLARGDLNEQVILTIPAGTYVQHGNSWVSGIKDIIIDGGSAATTKLISPGDTLRSYGGNGILVDTSDVTHTSYFQTVSAGASSITLVTSSEDSRFATGDWCLLLGVDTQSPNSSWPPNEAVFEYIRVASSSGGVVTFTAPLQYGYKSTWPYYGVSKNVGGPATIIRCVANADVSIDIRNITFGDGTENCQVYISGRLVKLTNCVFDYPMTQTYGIAPTGCNELIMTNCSQANPMEVDKCLGHWTVDGGTYGDISFASCSGGNLVTITGGADIESVGGTPKKIVIDNATIGTFDVGGQNFGYTDEVVISNSVVSTWGQFGSLRRNVDTLFSTSGNTIIAAKNAEIYGKPWAVPGGWSTFAKIVGGTSYRTGAPYKVLDLTEDSPGSSGNVYILTNRDFSAGFPSLPTDPTTGLTIWNHPCPIFTAINLTGSDTSVDLSQVAARGRPYLSYSKRSYTGSLVNNGTPVPIFGALVSIKVNVTQAYTGVQGTLTLKVTSTSVDGGNMGVVLAGAETNYGPTINLKIAGERIITPTAVTGAQSGDSISIPGEIYIKNVTGPYQGTNISGESSAVWPEFTIEIITDHGITTSSPTSQFIVFSTMM